MSTARSSSHHRIIGSQLGATPMHWVRPSAVDGGSPSFGARGSATTRRNAYAIARAAFDTAVKDRELADNPAASFTAPQRRGEGGGVPHPSPGEDMLEAASGTRHGLLLELLVNFGLRRGEAPTLKLRAHVKEDEGCLKVRGTLTRENGDLVTSSTKTAKSHRDVTIADRTAEILPRLRARQSAERHRAGSQ